MLRLFQRLFFGRKRRHVDVANIQKDVQCYLYQNWYIDGEYTAKELDLKRTKLREWKPIERKDCSYKARGTVSASLALRNKILFGCLLGEREHKSIFYDPPPFLLKWAVERDLSREKDDNRREELKCILAHLEEAYPSFPMLLLRMIKSKGISETKCYRRSNLDRRLFSKIRGDRDYHPQKNTVFALIIGLKLDMEEAQSLLQSAGYSFSRSIKMDVIMEYLIHEKIYDILAVNEILYSCGCPLLGSK